MVSDHIHSADIVLEETGADGGNDQLFFWNKRRAREPVTVRSVSAVNVELPAEIAKRLLGAEVFPMEVPQQARTCVDSDATGIDRYSGSGLQNCCGLREGSLAQVQSNACRGSSGT